MSLYKIREWWSSKSPSEEHATGFQNESCLKIDRIGFDTESDYVILAHEGLLRIYKPSIPFEASNLILEAEENDIIIELETGTFVAGRGNRQILVLQPSAFSVYELHQTIGQNDTGEQNKLIPLLKHNFNGRAFKLVCGHFGNAKTRELVAVLCLNGSLHVFDQDVMLFMCQFNDVIMPGPLAYIENSNCFIMCTSNWIMEVYSYQQILDFRVPEHSDKQTVTKMVPHWVYNAGEEIFVLQVIQTSTHFASIVALGDRHLYCFQDNGLLKFMKKLDYVPVCFCAYLIGWHYEPGARLLVMVASDESKLMIYENTALLWCCELASPPISVSRCFMKGLPGGVAVLMADGSVSCCYLGTEPDLSTLPLPLNPEPSDLETDLEQLASIEEELARMNDVQDEPITRCDDIVVLETKMTVSEQLYYDDTHGFIPIDNLECKVIVSLNFVKPDNVKEVQITVFCHQPFVCSENAFCLEAVRDNEEVELKVFLASEMAVSNIEFKILVAITEQNDAIIVTEQNCILPLKLACEFQNLADRQDVELVFLSSLPLVDVVDIFPDFAEDIRQDGTATQQVSLRSRTSHGIVTFKANSGEYRISANEYVTMTPILQNLVYCLEKRYPKAEKGVLMLAQDFNLEMLQQFLKSVEDHAKNRIKLHTFESELKVLQDQFRLIQKKLLVQYGSLPPGTCEDLEFLMKDTFGRLSATVAKVITGREAVKRAGSLLESLGELLILTLKATGIAEGKLKLLSDALSIGCLYDYHQDWEESASQAVSFTLQEHFTKTEKEREKLATISEDSILKATNLKKFLKQIKFLLEKLLGEVDGQEDRLYKKNKKITEKPKRVEELVDVI